MTLLSLPGPQFLAVWMIGAGVVAVLTVIVLRAMEGAWVPPHQAAARAAALHPTELAFLSSGTGRAVEAAVAGLVRSGALVVEGDRLRVAADAPRVTADGVYRGFIADDGRSSAERYVLAALARNPNRSVSDLVDGAVALDAELTERAVQGGDLAVARLGRGLVLRLPGLVWLCVGLAKLAVGIGRGRPVDFLVIILLAAGYSLYKLTPHRLTRQGSAVVRHSVEQAQGLRATATSAHDQLSGADAMLAYALFGALVAPASLAPLMPSYQAALAAASTSSSSCSSGCGSSCGGGCGGGCGGCS